MYLKKKSLPYTNLHFWLWVVFATYAEHIRCLTRHASVFITMTLQYQHVTTSNLELGADKKKQNKKTKQQRLDAKLENLGTPVILEEMLECISLSSGRIIYS